MSVSNIMTFDPANANNWNDLTPTFMLGAEFQHVNGLRYRYVKHDNGAAVATVQGGAAYWMDRVAGIVTSDKTSSQYGAAVGAGVAGIYQGVITDLRYTWIVIEGVYTCYFGAGDGAGAVGNRVFGTITDVDLELRSETDASVAAAEIAVTEIGRQLAAIATQRGLVALHIR